MAGYYTRRFPSIPTVSEIAARLKVDKSTVSRALNERPGRMSSETRQRIVDAAREMGYVPNPAARAINNLRSGNIGVVTRQFNNALYTALLLEIATAVDERGGNLVTCITGRTTELHGQNHLLHSGMVDGIVTFPHTRSSLENPDSPWMKRPIVFLLPDAQEAYASTARFDDAGGVALTLSHLFETGHRRPFYLQGLGPLNEPSYIGGHRLALMTRDWRALTARPDAEIGVEEGQATVEGGYRAMDAAIRSGRIMGGACDAVICYNDQMAIGALSALHAHGISVPRDISIIGWNDLDESLARTIPPLTTIHASARELSRAALDILYRQIEARAEGRTPDREHACVPVRLTVRESTRTR